MSKVNNRCNLITIINQDMVWSNNWLHNKGNIQANTCIKIIIANFRTVQVQK